MRTLFLAAILGCLVATSALADSCIATADAKKLAGAARTSFVSKCVKDAVGQ